ncbi:MAG TPA: phosphoribosyltransferase, partial [Flavobacterium sp.]|nr:phosphoribosyltransferase [Flavobacterium sp.]
GSLYYPGMIKSLNVKEHCQNLFSKISALVNQLLELDRNENIVLFLGTIDCLKNYLLILLNALDHIDKRQNLVELLNRNDYENLQFTIEILAYFQFRTIKNKQIEWSPDPIKILNIHTYQNVVDKIILRAKFDSENIIRKFRECNNPQKLVRFAENIAREYFSQDTLIVSFSYGGIELPFAVNAARMIRGKTTLPFIVCSLSNYSVRNIQNISDLNDSLPSYYSENYFRQFHKILILDDSVTTGKTIQTFIDLYPITLKEIFLGVVAFKNSNRYHHLIRPFNGGINPIVLDSAIIIFPNNYTKTYKKFSYTNRSGVFDKEKQKVAALLKKFI